MEQFAGEINAITNEAQPESIRVILCDAAVQVVEEFCPSEPVKLSLKGGAEPISGRLPFKWVEENGIEPKCLHLPDRPLLQLVFNWPQTTRFCASSTPRGRHRSGKQ